MQASEHGYHSGWRPGWLCAAAVAAGLLLASWALPGTRASWGAIDMAAHGFFNPPLAEPGAWAALVAVLNWRPIDLVTAMIIFVLLLQWMRADAGRHVRERFLQIASFCVLLLLSKAVEQEFLHLLDYHRQSPTLAVGGAVRLSHLVNWIHVKDSGNQVFPGDHASVIFDVVGFLWIMAGRRTGLAATAILVPFTVPRIAIGAHWVTDVAVGAAAMSALFLGLAYATPLACWLADAIGNLAPRPVEWCLDVGRRMRLLT